MVLQKRDRIQQLADSLKESLDGGVDTVAEKIRAAQVFAEEQSDALNQNNQALKGKLAAFLNNAKTREMTFIPASTSACPAGSLKSKSPPD